jgi:cytoskeletal protein CcmA (bactofilin family)
MRKKDRGQDSISTFLGQDASVNGTITFQGTIRIDGRVEGKVVSEGGTIIVGEKAVVAAELEVGTAIVMGEVNGTIAAAERIELYPPGRITGDVQSPVVSIEEGGVFNGNCVMKERTVSLKKIERGQKVASGGESGGA